MDSTYLVPKLLVLAKLMYGNEPFAKYSERRGVYIFGSMLPFGNVIKNIVHPSVAIYLSINQITNDTESKAEKFPKPQTHRTRTK